MLGRKPNLLASFSLIDLGGACLVNSGQKVNDTLSHLRHHLHVELNEGKGVACVRLNVASAFPRLTGEGQGEVFIKYQANCLILFNRISKYQLMQTLSKQYYNARMSECRYQKYDYVVRPHSNLLLGQVLCQKLANPHLPRQQPPPKALQFVAD